MTKREFERRQRQDNTLLGLGFTQAEADQLRRISVTLQRWHEMECGDGNQYGIWAIERDDNGDGPPFMVRHHYRHGQGKDYTTRTRIPDRETGAKKRLAAIVAARNEREADYPHRHGGGPMAAYIQTDPRGAALYILRPGDVTEGADVSAYYSRGICVY